MNCAIDEPSFAVYEEGQSCQHDLSRVRGMLFCWFWRNFYYSNVVISDTGTRIEKLAYEPALLYVDQDEFQFEEVCY
jgi:hypothetical protein